MLYFILLFVFSLAGLLAGLYHGIYLLSKVRNKKTAKEIKSTNKPAPSANIPNQPVKRVSKPTHQKEDMQNNSLYQRLPNNPITMSEFNCAADGIDYSDYLRRKREDEETAYHVMQSSQTMNDTQFINSQT